MKKRNILKCVLKWILIFLGILGIPFYVWMRWGALLCRNIYQWTSIKISIGTKSMAFGYFLIFCLGAFLIWYFISRSVKRRKERQSDWSGIAATPRYGYQEVRSRIYGRVKWVLKLPNPEPFPLYSPAPLEVAKKLKLEGPFCPNCDTELEENKRFFGYTWICVKCRFCIKSKIPIYKLREKAYLCFKSDIREHLRKQTKK